MKSWSMFHKNDAERMTALEKAGAVALDAASAPPPAPNSADETPADADHLDTVEVLRSAVLAGVHPDRVIGPWLEFCLTGKNLAAAREAIETCAQGLGLAPLAADWTFSDALARSAPLRETLHVSVYNLLDAALVSAKQEADADAVMLQAVATYPQYSGPSLRLAHRLYQRKQRAEGDKVILALLRRIPNDVQGILLYASQASQNGATPESPVVFASAIAAGVASHQIVVQWIDSCLKTNNLLGARAAVEACAAGIGLTSLPPNWIWPDALAGSSVLKQMHVGAYVALDEALLKAAATDEADNVMRLAIEAHPQFSGPALRLAHRQYGRKQRADGDRTLLALLRQMPAEPQAIVLYARQTVIHGLTAEGHVVFTNAVKAGLPGGRIIVQWIEASLKAGDVVAARNAVELCASDIGLQALGPNWTWATAVAESERLQALHITSYNHLDDALIAAGQVAEADALMRQVIAIHPKVSSPVLRLAQRLYNRNEWPEGDKVLIEFLSETPNDVQASLMLARRVAASGSTEDTFMVLEAAVAGGAPADSLISLWLETCLKAGDIARARRAVEMSALSLGIEALPADWTWPQIMEQSAKLRKALQLGLIYQLDDLHIGTGDRAAADAILQSAMQTFPKYSGPVLRLASRLADDKKIDEALKLLASFLKRIPGDAKAATLYARLIAKRRTTN